MLEEGLAQIAKYRDKIDTAVLSNLVIFDRCMETKAKP
jgi:hypothetical protein